MTDTHDLSTAPKTYQEKEEWGALSQDDRAWHHRRDELISQGRANGGKIFLSNRQRTEYQIAPDDLLPASGPVRLAEPEIDPLEREAARLATESTPPTLAALTGRLDEIETRASALGSRLADVRREHREEAARIAAMDLTDSADAEMKARAASALEDAERAIQADAEALGTQAGAIRSDLGTMSPPARISKHLATDAAAYLPHVSAEAALMTPDQLAARARGVIAQEADDSAVLAWLTAARQRLATLAPTDTARHGLQAAIQPLSERFIDTNFATSQGSALNRIENGIGKLQNDIRRGQQERGIFPAWLGDLNSSRLA